ncbi:small GTP-binding protein [Paenibacillus endophyticus]|uniref:Small GTP-binding protein n=1 Tax=Paenibacillus endophyticus TaxID=1294268 RepID=A0A7W5C5Y7_9BACL|nr:dynamin family protein [Paenibacillus endophyticus]MBB3151773.1 small GTP-binding protein [Paenibacillus endophyticus]
MTEITVQSIAGAISEAAGLMAAAGDTLHAKQAQELNSKLTEGRLTVAFCGHFSAGKSTLINRLCGTKLLPSSPIPTSANVVSIRGGDRAYAEVETVKNGVRSQAEVPIDELDRYCVDGEQFTSVSIIYPSEQLGNHTVLLDTPGIDSTDDAHRMATESALHLADVVFYVMDYNHVQSEINFAFAKQLKDWGKPLYFIVNQIDKHRERELSFSSYRQSVEDAFHAWHLEPAGIVYLSLREPSHPHQEWDKFLGLLDGLQKIREPLCIYSVDASLRHLAAGHLKWSELQAEPERERLIQAAGGEEAAARVSFEMDRLKQVIEQIGNKKEVYRAQLRKELQTLLDNANITPAGLRDLAQSFLESRKPGFKAGLLFAAAKTAAEQERRLTAFSEELNSLISASIDWHVKHLLRTEAERADFDGAVLEAQMAQSLAWLPNAEWLISRVKAGAVISNEYTMTFSRDLAADVKAEYRQRALVLIDALADHAAAAGDLAAAEAQAQLAALRAQAGALMALAAIAKRAGEHEARLTAALHDAPARPALPAPRAAAGSGAAAKAASEAAEAVAAASEAQLARGAAGAQRDAGARRSSLAGGAALAQQHGAAARLAGAAELLAPHAALAAAAEAMRDKAKRLQDSRFTIALFGAFSAGKSSLANALIGEPVLPVSPNPTTAAINRIVPPTAEHGHGTARIVMKSRAAIEDDVRYSLALLGEKAGIDQLPDAAALMRAIDRLTPDSIGAGGRPHFSFLRAARAGWERHEPLLGQQLSVDQAEYERYVAEESRSCFVSEIELYYDCELTAQGIVLVDTPGADSVNARHTGVAFNYIKNADAILFVTYYNHAFSQADRQFLMQLGRVKDQFELDKMFFLVNAADLAADEEELTGVLKHVETNLLQHAIRSPRLFPVSSLQALDGKTDGNEELVKRSGIEAFEQSFLSFIQNDLGRLAIEAAEQDLRRAAATVAGWLKSAEGDASVREAELHALQNAVQAAKQDIATLQAGSLPEQLKQELSELLYYVVQRIQYRFGEFYNFAFNPASLQDDGRDLKKAIWTSWLELQRLVQLELSQEMLATSLRMERGIHTQLQKQFASTAQRLESTIAAYSAVPYSPSALPTPEQPAAWEAQSVDAKLLWSRFKTPRHFFEGEGKSLLRKELDTLLAPSLNGWMAEQTAAWTLLYEQIWSNAAELAGSKLAEDMLAYESGKRSSLAGSADIVELSQLHKQLIHL